MIASVAVLRYDKFSRMDVIAHSLSAAAAAIVVKRSRKPNLSIGWTTWWAAFPDILAFGPGIIAGLWVGVFGSTQVEVAHGHVLPHVHVGLPLYQVAHSAIVFLVVFALAAILTRRIVVAVLGWLLHIMIDIPTHSLSYYATRFVWPISDYRIDGIAWWTPWFWATTYAGLAVLYFLLWKKGWMRAIPVSRPAARQQPDCAVAESRTPSQF